MGRKITGIGKIKSAFARKLAIKGEKSIKKGWNSGSLGTMFAPPGQFKDVCLMGAAYRAAYETLGNDWKSPKNAMFAPTKDDENNWMTSEQIRESNYAHWEDQMTEELDQKPETQALMDSIRWAIVELYPEEAIKCGAFMNVVKGKEVWSVQDLCIPSFNDHGDRKVEDVHEVIERAKLILLEEANMADKRKVKAQITRKKNKGEDVSELETELEVIERELRGLAQRTGGIPVAV